MVRIDGDAAASSFDLHGCWRSVPDSIRLTAIEKIRAGDKVISTNADTFEDRRKDGFGNLHYGGQTS